MTAIALRTLIVTLMLLAAACLLFTPGPTPAAPSLATSNARNAAICDPKASPVDCSRFIQAGRKNAAALISIATMSLLVLGSSMIDGRARRPAITPARSGIALSSRTSNAIDGPTGAGLLLRIGAPLSLALLEIFHPRPPADFFTVDLGRWLPIHYIQIWMFPLAALALVSLADRAGSRTPARICRVAMFIFATCFIAFDTAAGVVTAELVRAAHSSASPDDWRPAVTTIWTNPIIGGGGSTAPILAVVGTLAWLAGAIAAAVGVRRAGGSWTSTVLLVISGLGLVVFRSHAWPGGPLTFGALAAAAASIDLPRYRKPFPAPAVLPHIAGAPA